MSGSTNERLRPEFWALPLQELNAQEWEALCDHCGRCCLKKLEDEDSGELVWTRVVCRYHTSNPTFSGSSASGCGCYSERSEKVPECMNVRDMQPSEIPWMPPTCAYRLRMEGKPLFDWHPLLTGSSDAMEEVGITISGKVVMEDHVHPLGYDEHIIRWVEN